MRLTFIFTDGREETFSGITRIFKGKNPIDFTQKGCMPELTSGHLTIHYAAGKIALVDGNKVKAVIP